MNLKPEGGANSRSWAVRIAVIIILMMSAARAFSADSQPLTEYQVKSLCLLNFTKYIEWPSNAFSTPDAPIVIGCLSEGKVMESLKEAAEGKIISGRKIQVVEASTPDSWKTCNLLFVNFSERKRLPEILAGLAGHPVLTVGESEQFLEQGGDINFLKKDGKIRFEINVKAARSAHLEVSSKLLSLADNVQGKL